VRTNIGWLILLVQIFRAKNKIDRPTKFPWGSSGAGFLLYNREILVDGRNTTHKRVHLVPAALSPLLVVTGHLLCIQSAVFLLLHRCPRALLCAHGCNWVLPRWVFLQHSKCLPAYRRTWLFPSTSKVLLVVLVGVFLQMTLRQPTTLGRARSEPLTRCSYAWLWLITVVFMHTQVMWTRLPAWTPQSPQPLFFHRRTPATCTFVCVSIILCVQTDALASEMLSWIIFSCWTV